MRTVEFRGELLSLTEIERRTGVHRQTLVNRMNSGLSVERAVELGSRGKNKNAYGLVRDNEGAYRSWSGMRSRCLNESHQAFHNYGGRGIRICQEWGSFARFLEDMGPRPDGTELDRIDNDGNYEPSNCRWATRQQNARNRRTNRSITHQGETLTITEWATRIGVAATVIAGRLERGWSVAEALSPKRRRRSTVRGAGLRTTLPWGTVDAIRAATGPIGRVAKAFSVHPDTVRRIWRAQERT